MDIVRKVSIGLATGSLLALQVPVVSAQAAPKGESSGGVYSPVIASTVRVLALKEDGVSYGTGWVIQRADAENRAGAAVIVTARHVVAGASKVTVIQAGSDISDQRAATVISASAEQDIAFLEVKNISQPALVLSRARPDIGAAVAAVGYTTASDRGESNGLARDATLKRGGLSKYFQGSVGIGAQASIDQIEFDAPILAGFSGGPLLNDCGRVVGLTIKDGGHIRLGDGANVAVAQGVAVAVAADEIVRAAHAASVEVEAISSACDAAAPVVDDPASHKQECPAPYMSVDARGMACTPKQPTAWEKFLHNLKGPMGLLAGVALLALLVVIGTIIVVLRRRSGAGAAPVFGSADRGNSGLGSSLIDQPGARVAGPQGGGQSLRLTGRGAGGESIDLRFSADELRAAPVMLGVEGDANGIIPDNRAKTLVSRKHARVSYADGKFTIEDNKSLNKTKVGNQVLEPAVKREITSGDTITLADVVLYVTVE